MPEVELPLNAPVQVSSANGNSPASGVPASILVIDDEASIRESLEVLLSLEGYSAAMNSERPSRVHLPSMSRSKMKLSMRLVVRMMPCGTSLELMMAS